MFHSRVPIEAGARVVADRLPTGQLELLAECASGRTSLPSIWRAWRLKRKGLIETKWSGRRPGYRPTPRGLAVLELHCAAG